MLDVASIMIGEIVLERIELLIKKGIWIKKR